MVDPELLTGISKAGQNDQYFAPWSELRANQFSANGTRLNRP